MYDTNQTVPLDGWTDPQDPDGELRILYVANEQPRCAATASLNRCPCHQGVSGPGQQVGKQLVVRAGPWSRFTSTCCGGRNARGPVAIVGARTSA
jgi:hypothetical protein